MTEITRMQDGTMHGMRETTNPDAEACGTLPVLEAPPLDASTNAARRLRPAIIAIDGPAASGKSTVGYDLAQTIGYLFFDTGSMYRAVTHAALDAELNVEDESAIGELAEQLEIDVTPPQETDTDGRHATVLVNGSDVTGQLRGAKVDRAVSAVSAHGRVRSALSAHQRRIGMRYGAGNAEKPGVVMVGRDIGTVVIPGAPLKIFMEASAEERARRRYNEMRNAGKRADLEAVRADIIRRDQTDSERAHSPLRAAADSIVIDTSHLTPEQVVNQILMQLIAITQD